MEWVCVGQNAALVKTCVRLKKNDEVEEYKSNEYESGSQ